jgi:plastocyanin
MTVIWHAVRVLAATTGLALSSVLMPDVATGAPSSQDAQPVEIVLTEYAFGPAEPVVSAGMIRLRILNGGIRRHNLVLLVEGVELASPDARPGDVVEWQVQIERPGRYEFGCGEYRHLEKGMAGTLVVE